MLRVLLGLLLCHDWLIYSNFTKNNQYIECWEYCYYMMFCGYCNILHFLGHIVTKKLLELKMLHNKKNFKLHNDNSPFRQNCAKMNPKTWFLSIMSIPSTLVFSQNASKNPLWYHIKNIHFRSVHIKFIFDFFISQLTLMSIPATLVSSHPPIMHTTFTLQLVFASTLKRDG